MFKESGAGIVLGILLTVNPIAVGENNSSTYSNNHFYKSSKKRIDTSKVSIGGIKLNMSDKEIIKTLGKPKSRTIKKGDGCEDGVYITTWKYEGLEIRGYSSSNNISKSRVESIYTSSSNYITEKGIKVGDNISKAQKAYSVFLSSNDGNTLYWRYPNDDNGGLSFDIDKQGKITKIVLLVASC